ncbi:alpha/beta hydrolase [uncultured Rikenella sp.]|uniref:alpha/beta fold hydrolase n=1 Tax=uncultured Rikenella sp. TaxID=368003 RepID=UPI0026324CE1|nr:alpha/beta hydrolase [uncultured Rikenella sp.]
MEKFVIADGTPVRYADAGKGTQVVVLLHGYLESIEVWDDFAGELGREYRVIRVDLPGHGFSEWGGRDVIDIDYMADTVSAVLRVAGVEKCTVVGHSMGGYVALALAANHPEQVEGLVLFHSSPNADTPEKAANRQREIELIEAGKKEMLARVNPGKGFAEANLKRCSEAIEELSEQVMMTEDAAIAAVLRGMSRRRDRNDEMRRFGIPELMIFGRGDNYIPVVAAEAMAAAQPQARVAWLERSGHMGFIEQPSESLSILKEFLTTVAQGGK